jgi:hypothetical protein
MTTDRLDIRPFENAIARLEEGIAEYQADPARTLLRDGVISPMSLPTRP